MSRFTYYNNNLGAFPPQTTNPDIAIHYCNFMTGFWKDGSPFTTGGNGYGGTAPATFVYYGSPVTNTGWTEQAAGNLAGDRRFLQSAGPFTLKPGAVNDITFGIPWAQSPVKGGNIESLKLLLAADDKAQALFDKCFKLLDGPEAPEMVIQEMDKELMFYLVNHKGTNNYSVYNNDYKEEDISIISDPSSTVHALANPDKNYRFEGYIIYQVKDANVSSTVLIGTVAILRVKKGHADLLRAVPDILTKFPGVHFVIAGDGPQTGNLQKLIAELGLESRVHMLGLRRDVTNILQSLDIFVLPTHQEALGTAFIEAGATGLPVVATAVDGVREVVVDGETGILVPARDLPALSGAISRLLGDSQLRRCLGEAARRRVGREFSREVMAERMERLYLDLLAS